MTNPHPRQRSLSGALAVAAIAAAAAAVLAACQPAVPAAVSETINIDYASLVAGTGLLQVEQ